MGLVRAAIHQNVVTLLKDRLTGEFVATPAGRKCPARSHDVPHCDDHALLDLVQRQTLRYFWEGAHPVSFLARDRQPLHSERPNDLISVGGSGFGIMAVIVGVERGWIDRTAALSRLLTSLDFLSVASRHHGMFPHFMDGRDGTTIPFRRKDDGADIVETAFLFQGLICAREYFAATSPDECLLRERIDALLVNAEWSWFTRGENRLYWHWSPKHGWAMNFPVQGWNECLVAFVLAAGSRDHAIDPEAYHEGYAKGAAFRNDRDYYGIRLPLGMPFGGPLFFAHYSFCGLDPRGLVDRYADYFEQNLAHTRINHQHCVANPNGYRGYGPDCWGLTASHGPGGYVAYAPDHDRGVIAPSAALCSFPYMPAEAMQALRGFLTHPRHRIWGRYGFASTFCDDRDWYARTYLAVDQGPVVAMIENYRSGLLWKLFMRAPEIRKGLSRLGFSSPAHA